MKKYNERDFQLICEKRVTIQEVAKKYNVSVARIQNAMNRRGYYSSKRKILIVAPYAIKECSSVSEAARELNVSTMTIYKALKGLRVNILDELEIEVKEIPNDY